MRPHGIMVGWKVWADSEAWAEGYRRVYHIKENREMTLNGTRIKFVLIGGAWYAVHDEEPRR